MSLQLHGSRIVSLIDRRTVLGSLGLSLIPSGVSYAANPALPGWYADPEIRIFGDRYWIYPTYSADGPVPAAPSRFTPWQAHERTSPKIWSPFLRQTFLDAFSSPDLVSWTHHPRVLDVKDVSWAAYAMWAPSAIEQDGGYFLFFGANDIKTDGQRGGIGVAVSDHPEGPFRDAIGNPLIGSIVNGASRSTRWRSATTMARAICIMAAGNTATSSACRAT